MEIKLKYLVDTNIWRIIDLTVNIKEFNLDFDDAYQLTLSQKYDMTIVTFDKDFNAKGIVKLSPEEVLDSY